MTENNSADDDYLPNELLELISNKSLSEVEKLDENQIHAISETLTSLMDEMLSTYMNSDEPDDLKEEMQKTLTYTINEIQSKLLVGQDMEFPDQQILDLDVLDDTLRENVVRFLLSYCKVLACPVLERFYDFQIKMLNKHVNTEDKESYDWLLEYTDCVRKTLAHMTDIREYTLSDFASASKKCQLMLDSFSELFEKWNDYPFHFFESENECDEHLDEQSTDI